MVASARFAVGAIVDRRATGHASPALVLAVAQRHGVAELICSLSGAVGIGLTIAGSAQAGRDVHAGRNALGHGSAVARLAATDADRAKQRGAFCGRIVVAPARGEGRSAAAATGAIVGDTVGRLSAGGLVERGTRGIDGAARAGIAGGRFRQRAAAAGGSEEANEEKIAHAGDGEQHPCLDRRGAIGR